MHIQYRAPLILEDVQTDTSAEIDVGVVDWCLENHNWRGIRVVGGEVERKLESQVCVWSVCGAEQGGGPDEEGATRWEGGDAGRGGHH